MMVRGHGYEQAAPLEPETRIQTLFSVMAGGHGYEKASPLVTEI
jgi:hypothetical protein